MVSVRFGMIQHGAFTLSYIVIVFALIYIYQSATKKQNLTDERMNKDEYHHENYSDGAYQ